MNKAQWYRHLFGRIDQSIQEGYFFESAFISYGLIEDRLTSMISLLGLTNIRGVGKKIIAISKVRSTKLETAFGLRNWDGSKYSQLGLLDEILKWGELYRNPIQH